MMRTFNLSSYRKCLKVLPVAVGLTLVAGSALCAPIDSQNSQPLGAGSQTAGASVSATSPFARRLVLSNMEILGGGHLYRLSSRPPVFGPLKLPKRQESREERFLHLLFLVCALIGVFVAILALRSIPPASSKKES